MKSMLSEFAFKLPSPEIGDLFGDPVTYVQKLRTHGEELTKALVAALAVIADINLFVDDEAFVIIRQLPEFKALETALEPFKVATDDTKVAPK